jgi:hypothetical protein
VVPAEQYKTAARGFIGRLRKETGEVCPVELVEDRLREAPPGLTPARPNCDGPRQRENALADPQSDLEHQLVGGVVPGARGELAAGGSSRRSGTEFDLVPQLQEREVRRQRLGPGCRCGPNPSPIQ